MLPRKRARRAAAGGVVFVRDLEIVASVGVFEHEKRYEQRILVSVELIVCDGYDGLSDRLEQCSTTAS